MSIDVEGLRRTIRNIEEQMKHLGEEVVRLRRIADDAEAQLPNGAGLKLPPEIVVPRPDAVEEYLQAHPDSADVIREFAAALVDEFRRDRSAIVLDAEDDDYIDEKDLVFTVRVATYDDSFMDRLHAVEERFDDRLAQTSGSVYATTDYIPFV